MEWSLPTPARERYHSLLDQFSSRADVMPFLRGGIWRSFFTKYSESNLLHKKMLHVSQKIRRLSRSRRFDRAFKKARQEATTLLLRGQCNDPYWHGVFGGLYSPHLRTAVWRSLEQAETIADGLAHHKKPFAHAATLDFDADGRDEIYFTSDRYAALVAPDDGGTIAALDFRPAECDADQFAHAPRRRATTPSCELFPRIALTARNPFTNRRARRKRASSGG